MHVPIDSNVPRAVWISNTLDYRQEIYIHLNKTEKKKPVGNWAGDFYT